jgi:hypothetical protein
MLRVCGDIDILVPRPLVGQAHHLLRAMGYRGKSTEFGEESFQRRLLKTNIEYALIREERGFRYLLELHWGIFLRASAERGALEALWAEAYATPVFGVMAFQPSAEWSLLFLAVHAVRHQWKGLKWLSDIHELCTWTAIDWAKVRSQAERVRWQDMVELTLSACHALFDTPIPPYFSSRTLPPWGHLFPADSYSTEEWQEVLATARRFKSPIARWHYLMRALLVPSLRDREIFRLPSALGALYYPLRFLRLTIKYGWLLGVNRLRRLKDARSPR